MHRDDDNGKEEKGKIIVIKRMRSKGQQWWERKMTIHKRSSLRRDEVEKINLRNRVRVEKGKKKTEKVVKKQKR